MYLPSLFFLGQCGVVQGVSLIGVNRYALFLRGIALGLVLEVNFGVGFPLPYLRFVLGVGFWGVMFGGGFTLPFRWFALGVGLGCFPNWAPGSITNRHQFQRSGVGGVRFLTK